MGSTYLRRPCKPWSRTHRDTCRVNESPREARELFASRLKAWVRFLTLLGRLLCELENEKLQIENPPFSISHNRFRSGNKSHLV